MLRIKIMNHLSYLLLGFYMSPAMADFSSCQKALSPYEAEYDITHKNITMKGQRNLRQLGKDQYVLSQAANKMGSSFSEKSVFTLRDNQIWVDTYDMTRSILGAKHEYHSRYDWETKEALVTGNGDVTLPLDDRPVDLLSYQLVLRCDLEQGLQQGGHPVIAKKRVKHYEFKVSGKEVLETEAGAVETLVVDRFRKGDDHSHRIWVAPTMNYLIVKLEQSELKKGVSYKLQLKAVSFN